jgi:8-oxo-dGTP diphosphatase
LSLPTHKIATLCYILWHDDEKNRDELLLLFRNKKKKDFHAGKYVPIGGRIEPGETPLECVIREVKEETGYHLNPQDLNFKGYIYFDEINRDLESNEDIPGFNIVVFVYTTTSVKSKQVTINSEGDLQWFPTDEIPFEKMWEGDRIFTPILLKNSKPIEAKFLYEGEKLVDWNIGG